MDHPTKISVVLPVRDGEHRIVDRIEYLLDALADMTAEKTEVVVVDDGSQDATVEVVEELRTRHPTVRIVRHSRPRGMEAAGQSGLERAQGELVFIQETDSPVRLEDLQRLLTMSEDHSIVAARAESRPQPLSPALLRRLSAWGAAVEQQYNESEKAKEPEPSCLQMVRRPHLYQLATPKGARVGLDNDTIRATSIS